MTNPDRNQNRVVIGALIILVGAVALLDNLHLFDAREVIHFWPMVFVVLGALKVYKARDATGYVAGVAFVALGVLLTLRNMGLIDVRWRDWWPVLLILGGVLMLATGVLERRSRPSEGVVQTTAGQDSSLDIGAVLGGHNMYNDSQDFRGGEVSAILGGVDIDLRHASIQTEATIHVFAAMGGIEIKVPGDWSVVNHCVPLLGGVEDKSVPPASPGKRLLVKGYVIMGGVEIKN